MDMKYKFTLATLIIFFVVVLPFIFFSWILTYLGQMPTAWTFGWWAWVAFIGIVPGVLFSYLRDWWWKHHPVADKKE